MKSFSKLILKTGVILLVCIPGILYSQDTNDGELPQYLFTSFTSGTLIMKTGTPRTMTLNYNTLSEKIVFEQDGKYFDLLNQETVDTAYISEKQFIPFEGAFLELVVSDDISFLIQHKSRLEERGKRSGYGTYSTTTAIDNYSSITVSSTMYNLKIPDQFIIKQSDIFWIKNGNDWSSFTNKKQFLKIFPDEASILKNYLKENKLKLQKAEDITKAVIFLNGLKKQGQ